jgi:hypothetical protein
MLRCAKLSTLHKAGPDPTKGPTHQFGVSEEDWTMKALTVMLASVGAVAMALPVAAQTSPTISGNGGGVSSSANSSNQTTSSNNQVTDSNNSNSNNSSSNNQLSSAGVGSTGAAADQGSEARYIGQSTTANPASAATSNAFGDNAQVSSATLASNVTGVTVNTGASSSGSGTSSDLSTGAGAFQNVAGIQSVNLNSGAAASQNSSVNVSASVGTLNIR